MAGPIIANLERLIADIAQHTEDLPAESASPIAHYRRGANDASNLVTYFHRNMDRTNVYKVPLARHAKRLHAMALLTLVETFERFLKELAAVCVDHIGPLILDDRLGKFTPNGSVVALSFGTGTLGRLLCESLLWTDVDGVNNRFQNLLADETIKDSFQLFPKGKNEPEAWRRGALETLFQLRHSIVHNAAVITQSDAAKLRLLTRTKVDAPRVLAPTDKDVWYAKTFFDDTASWCDDRVATRLVAVLDALHARDPSLFAPQERADQLSRAVGRSLTVAGAVGTLV